MWLLKTKDMKGRERKILANGYNAKVLAEGLVAMGLPVSAVRVETYRDAETSRLWCLDPHNGRRMWVGSEEDLLFKGYTEVFYDDEASGVEISSDA